MSLFRVARDDGYLQQMLTTLKRFYGMYVLKQRMPPKDMFFERQDYQVHTLLRTASCHALA